MCDTLVATPALTAGKNMILAKNSDREANEAQVLTWVPAVDHEKGTMVECAYLNIPQVRHTYSVFLSRPFWMFGAEMGVNEHGVAIGNEAVFTRMPYRKKGLTGMDLLRLALERAATTGEALEVIAALLQEYGQGGNCAMEGRLYYHNSFLVADCHEAWIMETADDCWVARRVTEGAAISNILSIESDFDLSSPGIHDCARKKGCLKRGETLNFRKHFKDCIYSHFARGDVRRNCNNLNLQQRKEVTARDMMAYLRDHNEEEPFTPGENFMERVCMHAGGMISSQTTGSMVADLKKGAPPLVWFTGTSAPCLGFFRPWSFPDGGEFGEVSLTVKNEQHGLDIYGSPTAKRDSDSLWWKGEDIHRLVLPRYAEVAPVIQKERDLIEGEVVSSTEKARRESSGRELHLLCQRQNEFLIEKTESIRRKVISQIRENEIEPAAKGGFLRRLRKYNKKAQWYEPEI